MKKILILAVSMFLVLAAGCTGTSPASPAPVPTAQPEPTLAVPAGALPMNGSVILGNSTHAINVSVDSFEVGPRSETGNYTVTIYVAAQNVGKDPIKYTWFSELTDINGNWYGGIGGSHGGSGARSNWILPDKTEAARDYVIVYNDKELAALAKGAVLDVFFYEQNVNGTHSLLPNYHVTWVIDPDTIR